MRKLATTVLILTVSLIAAFMGCKYPLCPPGTEPYVIIDKPAPPAAGSIQILGKVIIFGWHSGLSTDPQSVRWLCTQVVDTNGYYDPSFDILRDLNKNPWRYESKWSKWVPYALPSGRTALIGKSETLQVNRSYIFAVQAKDFCGRVTTVFDRTTNVRRFIVSASVAPLLKVFEPYLGGFAFLGRNYLVQSRDLAPGIALNFTWKADASSYGGVVRCYRYGWDIADLNDPNDWEVPCSCRVLGCTRTLYAGVHTLFIEAVDNLGNTTLGMIEVNVVPFTMDRNLLWVDDFCSTNFTQIDWAMPTETQHDAFWIGLCGRAVGFDPVRDVYDVYYDYARTAPNIKLVGRYKNIVWSYSSSLEDGAWDDVIYFTPESMIGSGSRVAVNYLSMFLATGGHLLTEGKSDRSGGLAAALPLYAQVFPVSLECETTGPRSACDGDRSGVNSMPYRDYCVSVIDKIVGMIRTDADVPLRRVRNYDVLTYAYKSTDPATAAIVGLPDTLGLWSEITKPGRYFDLHAPEPYPGGFTFVEVYDPAYWMSIRGYSSQACFHPLFRMSAKNNLSALDNAAMALCLTKYENVVPVVESGIAVPAKSFHFGAELWFFDHQRVDQVMDAILNEWQIKATP